MLLIEALKKANITITDADISAELASTADAMGYLKSDGKPDVEGWLNVVMKEEKVNYDIYIQDAVWPTLRSEAGCR